MIIQSLRLRIIPCDEKIIAAILDSDEAISQYLNIKVAPKWSTFGPDVFKFTLQKIKDKEDQLGWLSYLPILKKTNTLIGSCGYKGKPDENGVVEIGYEVAERFQNNGLATEIAESLAAYAFKQNGVRKVLAHTLPEMNASVAVLQKNGFIKTAEIEDEEDGNIWRWELSKSII